ncbi:MAG: MFS transporter [Gemmatimonas sp.]|nr:MFS transporter [Gemmatimonas sp.]
MSVRSEWNEIVRVALAAWHTRLGLRKTGEHIAHYETADADRIPFLQKVAYGLGAFVNNTLAAAIGGMLIILNLGFGVNPALVGLASALPRITDALTDPLMGFISDNTRSRWGRRRPYIFAGAILSGIFYIALWWLPVGKSEMWYFWYFNIGATIFYVGYTIFATPWVALGYELTPDYHERTRLMGTQNFIGQLAYLISPWFLWIMTHKPWFPTPAEGAKGLAIAVGVTAMVVGIMPALFLRERAVVSTADPAVLTSPVTGGVAKSLREFFRGFGSTIRTKPFLKLCGATFLVFNGFIMIASFQSYVIIYYVFGGDQEMGAKYAGYNGTLGAASTFIVITIVTWLATQVGKRKAFFFSTGMSILGYGLKWFCYDPERPWLVLLPAPLIAFGLGGLFTLMGSMIADVVDEDELTSRQRREGMFGSIFWWVVKVGMAAALAAGGFLLNATGFDVALGGAQTERTLFLLRVFDVVIPMITSALAIWMIASYPITEKRAHTTRVELERRRSLAAAAASSPSS